MELPDKPFRICPRCGGEGKVHKIYGHQIRNLRQKAGLSAQQLASLTGFSYSHIYKTERGEAPASEPMVAALMMIDAFAAPVTALLEGEGEDCAYCYGQGKLPSITGEDLRQARHWAEEEIGRKVPISELARAAGVSVGYMSEVELGTRGNRDESGLMFVPEHFIEVYLNYEPEPRLTSPDKSA